MYIGPDLILEGIGVLQAEIDRQVELGVSCSGQEWPENFDPNDLVIYQDLLRLFMRHISVGYNEEAMDSKPMRMFFQLLESHRRQDFGGT